MAPIKRAKTWSDADSTAKELHLEGEPELNLHEQEERIEKDSRSLKEEVRELKEHRVDAFKKRFFHGRRFWFPIGVVVGVLVGFIFLAPSDISGLHASLLLLMEEYEVSIPKIADIDFSRVELEWRRLTSNVPEFWKLQNDGREFQVGEMAAARGLSAKHPVILIPGVISTGLESWSTSPDYRAFFRQKVWGGFNMVTQVMFNKENWISAMMLDPITGLDPPEAKVRAAEGIDAASSFIQGYWIWSKIVENLAVVNYDTNNLHLAPYDWRLSYYNLEVRDGYFSKLKTTIEGFKKRHNEKSVIAAHSMGANVVLWFFKWVESPEHGNGGPNWVEDHIASFISIAGTHLGVAKAMTCFLSGEMKDTVQLNPAGAYVLERFFSRRERQNLFRSWAGSASLWIKGGEDVWGNATNAPDDDNATHSHGDFIAFRKTPLWEATAQSGEKDMNMTAAEATNWILEHTPSSFQRMMGTNFSVGIERNEEQLLKNNADHTKWSNPLEIQLPNAPSMKMICVYGHGKPTERSYWYARGKNEYDETVPEVYNSTCIEPGTEFCDGGSRRPPLDMPLARQSWIDFEYTDDNAWPKVENGVKMGEGDGTVSLLSLGAMCVEGWKRPRWNPAGIDVRTVELLHQPVATLPRGGANTSEHVDILGSQMLNDILVKVATGAGEEVKEQFNSNIRDYARRVKWD